MNLRNSAGFPSNSPNPQACSTLENPISAKSFSQFLTANQAKYGIRYSKHVLDNHRGFHNVLVLIDPNKPGVLDGTFFEEQQNQAPYAPFLP